MQNKSVTKLTLTVSGIQEDILSCVPDGKKAAVLNGALLESAKNGTLFGVFFEIFGVQEGQKIKRKVEKILNGVGIDSNQHQNSLYKETQNSSGFISEDVKKDGIIYEQKAAEYHSEETDVVGSFQFFEDNGGK